MKRRVPFAVGALVLIGAQALFVAGYIGHEHTIYYWDHAMYIGMARQAYAAFSQDFSAGRALFENSLAGNYNLIFALPSLLSFGLFGASRLVFILTNFFVFFLAYEIAIACFLRRALGIDGKLALLASFVFCAAVPPLWLPLLEGYPDIGAAACIVFATVIGLRGLQQPGLVKRAITLGLVLGFAVLLRRHFVYPAIALLMALGCLALWDIARARKDRRKWLEQSVFYFAACGAAFVAVLVLIAPDFLRGALTVDYGKLYLSYRRPPAVFLRFTLGGFGYGLLLVAASGLALLAQGDEARRRASILVALFTFLWLAVWCAGPDQEGHHYMLHALPLFIVTGLGGWLVYVMESKNAKKYALGGALALFLFANSAWALWFSPSGAWPNDNGTPGIFSAPRPPVVRSDYDEWLRLATYLQNTTAPSDRIMMVGSSFVFNQDLMRSVYVDLIGDPGMTLRFVRSGEIDHEEPAPFDAFATANVYLAPEPAQYHLDPSGQRVVTAAANRFPPTAPYAALFHEDPEAFHLAGDTVLRIWRRDAWTPGALHEVLAQIRRDGPQDANFTQDWAATEMPLRTALRTDANGRTSVAGLFDPAHGDLRLFFDYPLEPGAYRLGFSVASECPAPHFRISVLAPDGKTEISKDFASLLMPGNVFQTFDVPQKPPGSRFLQLDVTTAPEAMCRAELLGLQIEKLP